MGSSNAQGVLCLPSPTNLNVYFLIYFGNQVGANLMSSKVDMSANSGLGDVIDKNKGFFSYQYYLTEKMTATKHGNGRDWWIITPNIYGDTMFVFLLTTQQGHDTIIGPMIESTGIISFSSGLSQMTINDRGDRIASVSEHGGVYLLNFDRCSGTMSNPVILRESLFPNISDTSSYYGYSFSPNGSKLYIATYGRDIWQVNLENELYSWYRVWFNPNPHILAAVDSLVYIPASIRIGPDNKVYCSVYQSTNYPNWNLNYNQNICSINSPDSLGVLCNFTPFNVNIGSGIKIISGGLPTYVNYNLGALDESICDTLNLSIQNENLKTKNIVSIYPNPSSNTINISSSSLSGKYSLKIYSLLGQQVKQQEIDFSFEGSSKVNIESLASGCYQLMLVNGSNVVSKRFVKE